MITSPVAETSVTTNNSLSKDYPHLEDPTRPTGKRKIVLSMIVLTKELNVCD